MAKLEVQGLGIVSESPFALEAYEGLPGVGRFFFKEAVQTGQIRIRFY